MSRFHHDDAVVRIIGGRMGGRKLRWRGDPRTRPMKDRVREAVFNLVGPLVGDMHALDLFAGTGAVGLEALSRGAATATLIERHFPTGKVIQDNVADLAVADRAEVVSTDAFFFVRQLKKDPQRLPQDRPWAIFCSPPYRFYSERRKEMLTLIESLLELAPPGSLMVVEADRHFDFGQLPQPERWDVRSYPPAIVGVFKDRSEKA